VARARLKLQRTLPFSPNVTLRDLVETHGFSGGSERITYDPVRSAGAEPKPLRKEIVLFRKASNADYYDLAATCEAAARTTCILHFSLSCNPALYVAVHGLDETYLDRASDVVSKTDHFIGSMLESSTNVR